MTVAGNFFHSLVSSAPHLPDLRTIRIKASINESGWRERKQFKDTWIDTLNRVFLRENIPPNPHLESIAAYKDWKRRKQSAKNASTAVKVEIPLKSAGVAVSQEKEDHKSGNDSSDSDRPLATSVRRSRRTRQPAVAISQDQEQKTIDDSSNSDLPLAASVRRSGRTKQPPPLLSLYGPGSNSSSNSSPPQPHRRRRRKRRSSSASSAEDSSFSSSPLPVARTPTILTTDPNNQTHTPNLDETSHPANTAAGADSRDGGGAQGRGGLFRQGKCNIVDLKIDCQRPTEMQVNEDDFLDEEVSGDEDWNGEDDFEVEDGGGYAW